MARPKHWKHYLSLVESKSEKPGALLATFAARYRFASSLEDLKLSGFAEATKEGYLVVTRLAYAYSALEALEKAIGLFDRNPREPVIDFRVAGQVKEGKFDQMFEQLIDAAEPRDRERLQKRILTMEAEIDSGNVRTLVEGIRNSLFHGKFTPTAAGLNKSKSRRTLLNKLADEVLLTADDRFASWLRTQKTS